jgi:hypothetical protein
MTIHRRDPLISAPMPGNEDRDEQRQRDDEDRDRQVAEVAEVDAHCDDHPDEADPGPDELLEALRRGIGVVEVRAHARCRIDHDDADGRERHRGEEEGVGRLVPLASHPAAWARRGDPTRASRR